MFIFQSKLDLCEFAALTLELAAIGRFAFTAWIYLLEEANLSKLIVAKVHVQLNANGEQRVKCCK